jgi:septal ring factor EnvC (AmiA/AmiB activator)
VIIGSIGTLITVLTERIRRNLATNTRLTQETKTAANGTLTTAIERLAAERNTVFGLRQVVRERDDRLAYLLAHHPEAEATMNQYKNRRTRHATEADEHAALAHLLADAPLDDPTGSDAGAHPSG